jgi:hypothetical protein
MKNLAYKIFAFCMISLFVSNTLIKAGLFVNYQINKAEITRKYCENKAKPMLHCNGKCYLAKQLAKEQAKEEQSNKIDFGKSKIETSEFTLNQQWFFETYSEKGTLGLPSKKDFYYTVKRSDKHTDAIFHPPTV